EKVKEALKGTDTEAIKKATEALCAKFYEVSAKVYQAANPQQDPAAGAPEGGQTPPQGDDNVVDTDYEVVE
ncbi:MAG: molecular chaperone DnaK, partial [Clostridia bacterium]|nr:molecular chaperone DnaK [Clostridia bacterium]